MTSHFVRIFVFLALLLFFNTSCSKDFLDPEPLSFYSPENVFSNPEGYKSALVTVRKDLLNDFLGNRSNLQMDHAASDFGYGIGISDWTVITPSTGSYFPVLQFFEKAYEYIKNTNVIISRIDDIEWSNPVEKNAILGEAYFYRAWWYYRLITSYGDVPFIGFEVTGPKLDFYTHSRWTILEKLISDLEKSSQWLPEKTNPGSPNKYAALHFLSKLYLFNTQYDKAVEAATSVINGPYDLMRERFGVDASDKSKDVLWDLHRPSNKSIPANKESIFTVIDRAEAPSGAKTGGSYTMRGFHCPWWYSWVLDSEGSQGMVGDGEQYKLLGRANPDVSQTYFYSYEIWEDGRFNWKNTPDLRRSDANWWDVHELIYNNPNSVDFGKPVNTDYLSEPADSLKIWPMPYHKTYYPHESDFTGRPVGGNGDTYVFRLAETYLIRAEAYFWNNKLDLATDDINVVRERANAPVISKHDLDIDFIFDERLRELAIEEMRHTEMVRVSNIMAKSKINGYSLDNFHQKNWWYDRMMDRNSWLKFGRTGPIIHKTEPKYVHWPIMNSVIATNTMGVINQNEGFEGSENNVPPLTEIVENEDE